MATQSANEAPLPVPSPRWGRWFLLGCILAIVVLLVLTPAIVVWQYQQAVLERRKRIDRVLKVGYAELDESGSSGQDEWIEKLIGEEWKLPRLREAGLHGPSATDLDEFLKELTFFTELEAVRLTGTRLSDDHLRRLHPLRSLRSLHLDATDVTDEGLAHLNRFGQLQNLNLTSTAISDRGIDALAQIKSLRHVDLRDTYVSERGAQRLGSLLAGAEIRCRPAPTPEHYKTLRELIHRGASCDYMDGTAVLAIFVYGKVTPAAWTDFDWSRLRHIDEIAVLSFDDFEDPRVLVTALSTRRDLRTLSLNRCGVNAEVVERTVALPSLESLFLQRCTLPEGLHLEGIAAMTKLEYVVIERAEIDGRSLKAVLELSSLREIVFNHCQFRSDAWQSVTSAGRLEVLSISESNVSDDDFQAVADMKSLKSIFLDEVPITDKSLDVLLSLPNLESAVVHCSGISQERMEKVQNAIAARLSRD